MLTRIVLTGGPSAGKTTLLEQLDARWRGRAVVAPEAASILFRGGISRPETASERIHTQRSIYALQSELEMQAAERLPSASDRILLCDRGSLDGAAYWAGGVREFCFAMGTTLERELARYQVVIHLQTAPRDHYCNTGIRTENHEEACRLDERIGAIWGQHPNYVFVPNPRGEFQSKLDRAVAAIEERVSSTRIVDTLHSISLTQH